jgi:galactose mutarotase-like enzyme
MDLVTLASPQLACTVDPLGAELQSLTGADGRQWLWDGDRTIWNGRAPILFPVVGMLADGAYRWQQRRYRLDKHGFARRRRFTLLERSESSATLRLAADDATWAVYPFAFELDLTFTLDDALTMNAVVRNRGDGPMPFSFGFHPALRWPRGVDARLCFDCHEAGPVWRLDAAGLMASSEPLAGDGRVLMLDDDLFAQDAMILREVASREVTLETGGDRVRLAWDNLPSLGLWSRPEAPFLCIEPWAGFNDPHGFDGTLDEKPGIVVLAPGANWTARLSIAPERGQPA